ncbi:PEP-CTERM sorting domain-containing protein [Neptunicella marina]|uniref:PEP-CTERM sorting domain-containing protein n=1 Tax=Neptunicella marina TaxID=2125989 RepID=A0A8J6ITK6_9ALTE|nr:PEP-CTERM sorting domain-containing protein [Neptunicella marina]MBC3765163.1 PEP-CTERM sorting domain-containing protein [Neptunicella marina]
MNIKNIATLIFCGLAFSNIANADLITLTDPETGQGLEAGQTTPAAPLGNSAWSATTFGNAGAYSEYYLYWDTDPSTTEYYLGDLISLSFDTLKNSGVNDFFIQIYTTVDGNHDGSGWYGQRLTFDPLYANNINAPANNWNTWSTLAGTNQLNVYDHQNYGGYAAPTLAQLLDGSYVDDPFYTFDDIDYSREAIRGITIKTGSAWGTTFSGSIDNVNFDFGNKGQLQFDLEANSVPEPAMLVLFSLGLIGLRRKLR